MKYPKIGDLITKTYNLNGTRRSSKMATKKKRKAPTRRGLGSSMQEHDKRLKLSAASYQEARKSFQHNMRIHECSQALDDLLWMQDSKARSQTEAHHGSSSAFKKVVRSHTRMISSFYQKCLIK